MKSCHKRSFKFYCPKCDRDLIEYGKPCRQCGYKISYKLPKISIHSILKSLTD